MQLDVSDLPLVGGNPALDLVNTVERGIPIKGLPPYDYLTDPAALLHWTVRTGLVTSSEADTVWRDDPAAARAGLIAVREIREDLHLALLAAIANNAATPEAPVPGDDRSVAAGAALVRLHERWSASSARARLVLSPPALSPPGVRLAYGTVPATLVPDRAAAAAVDVLLTADFARVRSCPVREGGCGWLFLDQSRNGSRRWCRMADCGNTTKARRLTEKRRASRNVH